MKLTVEYDPNVGHVERDGEAEKWVDEIIATAKTEDKKDDWIVTVSSALLIDFFRLRLAQGVIKKDQIEFVFNDQVLNHNKYGRIEYWPKGFCDIPIEPMERLLVLASDKVKKKKRGIENA